MLARLKRYVAGKVTGWLTKERERPAPGAPLYDFDRLCYEVRPGDVILVEGRSRVSEVIKLITQSPWTHSALYIGRLFDIQDPALRERIAGFYPGDPSEPLVIEALLGEGTVVSPLARYRDDHLRICRPRGLAPEDAQRVIAFAAAHLGTDYDVRQLLDLARFLFPWSLLPRRWRSSLFEHNAGTPTRTVCSSMLAEAFASVDFPILPFIERLPDGRLRLYKRNSKLFTPRDFDYSPYFDIVKYPYLGLHEVGLYRKLPWDEQGRICNESLDECELPPRPAAEPEPAPPPGGLKWGGTA